MSEFGIDAAKSLRGFGRALLLLYKTIGRLAVAAFLFFSLCVAAVSGSTAIAVLMFVAYLPLILMLLWLQDEGDAVWKVYGKILLAPANLVGWLMRRLANVLASLVSRLPPQLRKWVGGTDRALDAAEPDKALEAAKTYWALDAAEERFERFLGVLWNIVAWIVVVVVSLVLIVGGLFVASILPKNDGFIPPGVAIIIGALIVGGAILYRRT